MLDTLSFDVDGSDGYVDPRIRECFKLHVASTQPLPFIRELEIDIRRFRRASARLLPDLHLFPTVSVLRIAGDRVPLSFLRTVIKGLS